MRELGQSSVFDLVITNTPQVHESYCNRKTAFICAADTRKVMRGVYEAVRQRVTLVEISWRKRYSLSLRRRSCRGYSCPSVPSGWAPSVRVGVSAPPEGLRVGCRGCYSCSRVAWAHWTKRPSDLGGFRRHPLEGHAAAARAAGRPSTGVSAPAVVGPLSSTHFSLLLGWTCSHQLQLVVRMSHCLRVVASWLLWVSVCFNAQRSAACYCYVSNVIQTTGDVTTASMAHAHGFLTCGDVCRDVYVFAKLPQVAMMVKAELVFLVGCHIVDTQHGIDTHFFDLMALIIHVY